MIEEYFDDLGMLSKIYWQRVRFSFIHQVQMSSNIFKVDISHRNVVTNKYDRNSSLFNSCSDSDCHDNIDARLTILVNYETVVMGFWIPRNKLIFMMKRPCFVLSA
jgi:hypothetical protein